MIESSENEPSKQGEPAAEAETIHPKAGDNARTVLDWLEEKFPGAKKTTLRAMVEDKRVTLNGANVKSLKQIVGATDKIDVIDSVGPTATLAEKLKIIYQDADVVIVQKPAGLLSSTHEEELRPTAVKILTDHLTEKNSKAQVHLIHRLDKDASGLLVFARNWGAFTKLKAQFEAHTITRQYTVVAHGTFKKPIGRLENILWEDNMGKVHTTPDPKKGKQAILDYEVVSTNTQLTLLKCTLFTGRKHQIRVQFQAAGHPVCADPVYGKADERPFRLALHASHLAFDHPKTGKRVAFDSPAPPTFRQLVGS